MHEVMVKRSSTGVEVLCTCGASAEWTGRDESSRSAARVWKTEHEKEQG